MSEKSSGAVSRRRLRVATLVGVLGLVAAYAAYVQFFVKQEQGLSDLFEVLEEQGYTANVGLSGVYAPGNVIQTTEMGLDGKERKIASPLLFLWGDTCFTDHAPAESPFTLPQSTGTTSASLELKPQALSEFLPDLNLQNAAVADYSLRLENTRVLTYARGDISRKFSEDCVHAWSQALREGDKSSWFAVIVETVVADELKFEMRWKSDSTVEARAAITTGAEKMLSNAVNTAGKAPAVDVAFEAGDEKTTTITAEGFVILGYRARPMELSTVDRPMPDDLRKAFQGSGTGTIAGRLAILLKDGGTTRRVGVNHEFRTGDRFQFEITSSEPGWLFILHQPPGGEMSPLWPKPTGSNSGSPTNQIRRNQTHVFPPDPGAFRFEDEGGDESFFVAVQSSRQAPETSGTTSDLPSPQTSNISVRGNVEELASRGVTYDDGSADSDAYIYFAPTTRSDGTVAAIKFQLKHE